MGIFETIKQNTNVPSVAGRYGMSVNKTNHGKYSLKYTYKIPSSNRRRVRGFHGIYVKYIPNIIERV